MNTLILDKCLYASLRPYINTRYTDICTLLLLWSVVSKHLLTVSACRTSDRGDYRPVAAVALWLETAEQIQLGYYTLANGVNLQR